MCDLCPFGHQPHAQKIHEADFKKRVEEGKDVICVVKFIPDECEDAVEKLCRGAELWMKYRLPERKDKP